MTTLHSKDSRMRINTMFSSSHKHKLKPAQTNLKILKTVCWQKHNTNTYPCHWSRQNENSSEVCNNI